MIAKELISLIVPPLKTSDTGQKALTWMQDFHLRHLPIVNNRQLLGLISEEDIINFNNPDEPIGAYPLTLSGPFASASDHLYEVLKMMANSNLTVVPVVDEEDNYLGLITQESLLYYFANSSSFTDPGSILVLEVNRTDYSMAEIARLVESENAALLSAYITSNPNSTQLEVTLKLNVQNPSRVKATLERFEYRIKGDFSESDIYDTLRDNYDGLLNYLNI